MDIQGHSLRLPPDPEDQLKQPRERPRTFHDNDFHNMYAPFWLPPFILRHKRAVMNPVIRPKYSLTPPDQNDPDHDHDPRRQEKQEPIRNKAKTNQSEKEQDRRENARSVISVLSPQDDHLQGGAAFGSSEKVPRTSKPLPVPHNCQNKKKSNPRSGYFYYIRFGDFGSDVRLRLYRVTFSAYLRLILLRRRKLVVKPHIIGIAAFGDLLLGNRFPHGAADLL